jgi:gliding motility-associated-like protein
VPVNFGPECTYTWTNSNPSIGLPASGAGNIPSFKAVNTTNAAITATITATPVATQLAYIACSGTAAGGYIDVINTTTDEVVTTIAIPPYPEAIAVNKKGDVLYTTNPKIGKNVKLLTGSNTITTYDAKSHGIAFSPDDKFYYYANETGKLFKINTTTNQVITLDIYADSRGVAAGKDGRFVFVANQSNRSISDVEVYDNVSQASTYNLYFDPYGVATSNYDSRMYVTNYNTNIVSAMRFSTRSEDLAVIPVGVHPMGVAVSSDGAFVYVTNNGGNSVSVIDAFTNTVIKTIPVGTEPFGISVTDDGKKVYVVNSGSSTVSVINTATNTVTATINVHDNPQSFGNFIGNSNCPPLTFTITVIHPIDIPNTFTPNNDGVNDKWDIKYLTSSYPKNTVEIFNRYGARLFYSSGYAVPWDGKYKGAPVPSGTYYYIINTNGINKPLTGYLNIIR